MFKAIMLFLVLSFIVVMSGCEATAKSDLNEPGWQTTASYDKIMTTASEPSPMKKRSWNCNYAAYEAPVVTHFGSYFNDPFTDGDCNDSYGWTLMDLGAVAYSPARFAVNALAVPVSMVKEPPGVLQCTNLDQSIPECSERSKEAQP